MLKAMGLNPDKLQRNKQDLTKKNKRYEKKYNNTKFIKRYNT